jgi:hypothetical protein
MLADESAASGFPVRTYAMLTTLDILNALAKGRMSVADAGKAISRKPAERRIEPEVHFKTPAAPQYRLNEGPRPRPVSSLVSDREVIHAVARGWVVPEAMELL